MILVTGGTGLVGSELVKQLAATGESVRVIYRNAARLSPLMGLGKQIEFFEADILDVTTLEAAMQGVSKVYHSAAYIGYESKDYAQLMKVNVEGTANVVNAMLQSGVKRLIHVSSIAAIGGWPGIVITESTKWEKCPYNTRYGLSKLLAEREVWRGVVEGLEAVIINPGIILGAGFWEEKNTVRLLEAIEKGLPFYTPGTNAYVDVRDVARIMIRLMESEINNERFIVIAENISFKEMMGMMAKEMGGKAPTIALNRWIAQLLAIADAVICLFTRSKRRLTKENLRVSLQSFHYSNESIVQALNYSFIPLPTTVQYLVTAYRAYKKTTLPQKSQTAS